MLRPCGDPREPRPDLRGDRALRGLPTVGYGPADIASAYQLDTSLHSGQTVAIVDAFDNPKVEANLKAFRAAWGLPPCTTANGCFRKVNQRGGSTPPQPDPGWGVEIALDVQAVSSSCPSCKILLVEANDPSFVAIGRSVNTAVRLGADVVSNSYGGDEFNGILDLGAAYYTHPGVAQVASSGDFKFGARAVPGGLGHVTRGRRRPSTSPRQLARASVVGRGERVLSVGEPNRPRNTTRTA